MKGEKKTIEKDSIQEKEQNKTRQKDGKKA